MFLDVLKVLPTHNQIFPTRISQWISHSENPNKVIHSALIAWMAGSVGEVLQRDPKGRTCASQTSQASQELDPH
jgi:hypothetical protein